MMRRELMAGVLLLLVATAQQAMAYDFIMYTQNMLRFGHGSRLSDQCSMLNTQLGNVDVSVLQEVMKSQSNLGCTLPGGVTWLEQGPFGNGSYKEYYLAIIRSTPRTGGPTVAYANSYTRGASSSYMRPPSAWLLNVTPNGSTTAKQVLVGDFHAVWGKTVSGRRNEVTAVATFYNWLKNGSFGVTPPTGGFSVIIGGDWNLPTTDTGFSALTTAGAVNEPNLVSSLTRTGVQSQPYDHFSHTPTMTLSTMQLYPATTWSNTKCTVTGWPCWRKIISDHLGVTAQVTLP